MAEARYYELNDDVGVDPKTGELQPLVEIGLPISRPTMVDGEVADVFESIRLQPIAEGSRVFKVDDPSLAAAIDAHINDNGFPVHETDPPKSEQPRKPKADADKKEG